MIATPVLDFGALLPLLLVAFCALTVLALDVVLTGRRSVLGRPVTREFTGATLAFVCVAFLSCVVIVALNGLVGQAEFVFNPSGPMMRLDGLSSYGTALVALAALLACLLAQAHLEEVSVVRGEFYALLVFATAGMVLLVSATDLITLFVGIEIMSLPLSVLVGFDRQRRSSNEAATKSFLTAAFASAISLYGMALLYGATGATGFEGLRAGYDPESTLAVAGLGLLIVGFAFRVATVPFHQWAPDISEGAPTVAAAFIEVAVKAAMFIALVRLFEQAVPQAQSQLGPVLSALSALSMVVGSAMALVQSNAKRMLAYAGVAQTGFLLLGFGATSLAARAAVLFYLAGYVFMTIGAFAALAALSRRGRVADRIDDFAGLAHERPLLAAATTVFLLSLAGVPGTVGFAGKFQLLAAAVRAGRVELALLAAVTSLVLFAAYLRIPVLMVMRPRPDAAPHRAPATGELLVLGICALVVLTLGIAPDGRDAVAWLPPVLEWSRAAVP